MKLNRRTFLKLFGSAAFLMLPACSSSNGSTAGSNATSSSPSEATQLVTTFLKVGKADATVLQAGDSCVVVDTGTADTASKVVDALGDLGVSRINALVITHFDQDHIGGAAEIINSYPIDAIYTSYQAKESDEVDAYKEAVAQAGLSPQQLSGSTSLNIGGVSYDITMPDKSAYDADTSNNSSLVTRVSFGSTSILLAGDVQKERIDELLTNGTNLSCDLLKVPHHGQLEDNTDAFVTACAPSFAVITSSKDEKEDREVEDILEAAGAEIFLTRKGTVTCTSDGNTLSVTQ